MPHAGREASAPPADALVVFLHGYGSNGSDFTQMATELGARLPHAAMLYPNAPTAMSDGPPGRPAFTWFEFAGGEAQSSREAARVSVMQMIGEAQEELAVADGRVVVVGFSQGGGVAINAASCAPGVFAAGIAIGGVVDTACPADPADDVALTLVHMEGDPRVPLSWFDAAQTLLDRQGHAPDARVFPGATHWPSPEAQKAALDAVVAALE